VAHASEVINNPFVELVAPVGEKMSHIGVCLAGSVVVLDWNILSVRIGINLLSQIEPGVLIWQDVSITVTFYV
jgi:hypothetical protein